MDNSVNNQLTKGADGRAPVPPAGRVDAGGASVRLPGDAGDRSLGDRATMPGAAGADASLGDDRTMRPGGAGPAGRRFAGGELLLGRYRVKGELGQGGMGVVYRCSDETAGIEVALKALPPEVARSSGEMEEVRANFRLVEKLHHPNIANVKTLERDPENGDVYLVMELVDGYDVRQWVRRRDDGRPLTLDEVTILAYRIAEALDYAQRQKRCRLPSEAEWEYACRAGTVTRYYSGDNDSDLMRAGWSGENSEGTTHVVGKKEPNSWGLYDMLGNVAEICGRVRLNPNKNYASSVQDPSISPATCADRGGHFMANASMCSCDWRSCYNLDHKTPRLGFRVIVR